MIKVYAMLIILAVLASVGYGAYWYYTDSQQRIATLTANNAKVEAAIQQSEAAIASIQKDMNRVNTQ